MEDLKDALEAVLGENMALFLAASAAFMALAAKTFGETSDLKKSKAAAAFLKWVMRWATMAVSIFAVFFTWALVQITAGQNEADEGQQISFFPPFCVVGIVMALGLVLWAVAKWKPDPASSSIGNPPNQTEVPAGDHEAAQ